MAAIFAASVAASKRIRSLMPVNRLPKILGTANRPSTAFGAAATASSCVRHGSTVSGRRDVDLVAQRVVREFHAGDVDGLDLADVGQNRVELAREAVQLAVGKGESGQTCEMGDVIRGDL